MKRLLIGLVAVAGLLAAVMALATSASSPASGQGASTNLALRHANPASDLAAGVTAPTVRFTITPVGGCNPGSQAPLQNGIINVQQGRTASGTVASSITGILSSNCNWNVVVTDAAGLCATSTLVQDADGSTIGTAQTAAFVLSGSGNSIRYNNEVVASLEASLTTTCASNFSPNVTINTAAGINRALYVGLPFTVTYTAIAGAGCTATASANYNIGVDGTGDATTTLARGSSAPQLLARTLAMIAANVTPTTNAQLPQVKCIYSVSYASEVGNLRQNTIAGAPVIFAVTRDGAVPLPGGLGVNGYETTNVATFPAGADITATSTTYSKITVPIKVTATYPDDEVFNTNDKVDYFITVQAPCGGYNSVIPSGIGSQGDAASAQVFPGSITVYGAALNAISNSAKTYSIDAYQDAAGTRACGVTVEERNGPERCEVVGDARQSMQYSAGTTEMAFEFTHTCTATAAASTGGDDADPSAPPAPPAIEIPGEGGTTTTAPSGPATEGAGRG